MTPICIGLWIVTESTLKALGSSVAIVTPVGYTDSDAPLGKSRRFFGEDSAGYSKLTPGALSYTQIDQSNKRDEHFVSIFSVPHKLDDEVSIWLGDDFERELLFDISEKYQEGSGMHYADIPWRDVEGRNFAAIYDSFRFDREPPTDPIDVLPPPGRLLPPASEEAIKPINIKHKRLRGHEVSPPEIVKTEGSTLSSSRRKKSEFNEPDNGPLTAAQKVTILDQYIELGGGTKVTQSDMALAAQRADPTIDLWRAEHYYQNVIKSTFVPLWFHKLALQHAGVTPEEMKSFKDVLASHMDEPRIMGRDIGDKNTIRIWYDFCIHPLLSAQPTDDLPCRIDGEKVRLSPKQTVKYLSSVREHLAGP